MKYQKQMTAYQRMMKRVQVPENKDECWLWCGPVNNAGYGMIRGTDGWPKMMTVHRVAAQHKGLDIKRKEVQHTCLTKNCVNPDHLVNGDAKTRFKRIKEKHGEYFQRLKKPYVKCKHCGKTSHVVWFSRQHGECHPGMNNKYAKLTCDKV